jgi:hypothetical protein
MNLFCHLPLPYRQHTAHCNNWVPCYVQNSVIRNRKGLAMVACPETLPYSSFTFLPPSKPINQCVLTVNSLGSSEPASLPQLSSNSDVYVSVDHRQRQCNSEFLFHNICNIHVLYQMYTVMRGLTTGIRSEKCVVGRFCHCAKSHPVTGPVWHRG